eukprot:TRINITY_DN29544_c0_g1_i1.p2 TRINITY_DN29544_c0_g1~~TRINITY_DN29544_c0_g1_i1.p2  ORF type:complete len:111 (-),score=5.45 TRINITY_DN29544_c0_g1_i1:182-493(-)
MMHEGEEDLRGTLVPVLQRGGSVSGGEMRQRAVNDRQRREGRQVGGGGERRVPPACHTQFSFEHNKFASTKNTVANSSDTTWEQQASNTTVDSAQLGATKETE